VSDGKVYRARITDDWLPFPEELLATLGWKEGDEISIDVCGDALVLEKVGEQDRRVIVRTAPKNTAKPLGQ
jgi:bifunctional DNA-binding transcriptional regulator/antitoxin component of YhaV-PrlF toxin-antitoxin module